MLNFGKETSTQITENLLIKDCILVFLKFSTIGIVPCMIITFIEFIRRISKDTLF
jgi:hypothetical protein